MNRLPAYFATPVILLFGFLVTGRLLAENLDSSKPVISYEGKGYLIQEDERVWKVAKIPFEWIESENGFSLPFESGATMEPVDYYSGPKFQLGFTAEISGSGNLQSNGRSAGVVNRGGNDAITMILGIGRDSDEAKEVTMEGVVIFPTDKPFQIGTDNAFSATVNNSFSGGKPEGRWAIKTSDGHVYASEETFRLGQPTFSTGLTTTRWFRVDTNDGQIKLNDIPLDNTESAENTESGTSAKGAGDGLLSKVVGAGVYVGGKRTGVSGKGGGAATVGFRVQRFVVAP